MKNKKRGIYLLLLISLITSIVFISADYSSEIDSEYLSRGVTCEKTDSTSTWVNLSIIPNRTHVVNSTFNQGDCALYSEEYNDQSCCPGTKVCTNATVNGSVGVCALTRSAGYCSQYENEFECGLASQGVGDNSVNLHYPGLCGGDPTSWRNSTGDLCVNYTSCSCIWDDGACGQKAQKYSTCGREKSTLEECSWKEFSRENRCSDLGKTIVNYKANGTALPEDWCADYEMNYPCSETVVVPFFTGLNFLISLLSISIFYILFRKKF